MTDTSEIVPEIQLAVSRRKASFSGDVLKLVSGTTIAQAIGILITPILTRLYAPEAFGTLALFISITSILGVIACMRYELAIMLPESDEEAVNLLAVSLGFTVLLSLLTIPLIWWGRTSLLNLLNAQDLAPYLWLIPPMVLGAGIFLALNYWNSRTKRFGRLSIARVIQAGSIHSIKLGAGFAGYTMGATLIGANVIGQVIATVILAGQIWRDDAKLFLRSIRWQGMWNGIKRYRKFPLFSIWSALLNNISWQLPAILLSAFFSSTVVGYYALGFRVIKLPMSLIGGAIAQVFFQRAAEAKMQGMLSNLVENVFRRLAMIGLFPLLMLTLIGPQLYRVVFGPEWVEAGVYTQILSVWAFFWFVSSPISTLFSVLEKQDFGLKLNVFIFLSRLASLWVGGYVGNPRLALLLFAATGVVAYSYLSFAIMAETGIHLSKILGILGQAFVYFSPFGALVLILVVSGIHDWILLIVVFLSICVYGLILYLKQPDLFHSNMR